MWGKIRLASGWLCLHNSQGLKDRMTADDSLLYMIPLHYTGLFEASYVGINKSFKEPLKSNAAQCRGI